jgi:hypothetical protein
MSAHTPGPWLFGSRMITNDRGAEVVPHVARDMRVADARLIAAAPDMLAALRNVQKIITDGAMTGFNYRDGDWAERLFESQQVTSAAIRKAEGKS